MPILTKASITKGTPAVFTLDKTELSIHAAVVADAYFSDMANWKYVSVTYKGSSSIQNKIVLFDISTNPLTALFKTSLFAEDIFLVEGVTIHDFDGGKLLLPRSAISFADFDIDMTPVSLEFFSQPLGIDTYSVSANSVVKISGADAYNSSIISTASISGDGYVQFTNASRTGIERLLVGIGKNPRTGSYVDIEYCFNNVDAGYGIYESGTLSYVSPVIPTLGDILKISRVSNVIKYYINGNLAYTSTFPASGSYYIEASLYDTDSAITNCSVVDGIPVVSNNVVWDITGPYTAQPNGGLTTTSTATYSNQYAPSKTTADDFDITFTFASAPTHDAGAGMVTDSNAIYGFIGSSASANIHYNNSGQQVIPFPLWEVGENIFRMTRVGTVIKMYLNSVVVGTTTYSGNLKPVVSMHTADVLTSANIVSSIAIPIPFSYNPIAWIPEANYVVEADGGMTSTNTGTSADAVIFSSTGISLEDFELSYNINCPSLNFGPNPTSEVFLGFSGSNGTQFSGFYSWVMGHIYVNDQGINTVPVFSQPILLNNTVKIIKAGTQLTIKWNEVIIYTGTP